MAARAPATRVPDGVHALAAATRQEADAFLKEQALLAAKSEDIAALRRAKRNPRLFLSELAAVVRDRPVVISRATLGEEIRQPRRSIPLAIIVTLAISMVLYVAVGLVGMASVGAEKFSAVGAGQSAPLEAVAQTFGFPAAAWVVALGAVTAMLGVLLNLILGLSRVILAMARRHELPAIFASIQQQQAPAAAVLAIGSGVLPPSRFAR